MKRVVSAFVIAGTFWGHAFADPMEDALYIVDTTVNSEQLEIVYAGLGDLMLASLENELAKEGLTITKDAGGVYVKMLTSHMTDAVVEAMREPLAEAYVVNLSPEALAAYRGFLETEAGQEVARNQNTLVKEATKIGENLAVPVATMAVQATKEDMKLGNWPQDTLRTTQNELLTLMNLPPISPAPPER
ncbi:hypothetical protein [uncultured Hyphomonas sp.]|uniref:hypothetical protein n=1 Tax=uncultured Hyphomonas sp. TaxID=225298 RepID=UPI002AABD7A2|nr:hypothetical protein [uncultured Hyphomonas sp.]